MERKVVCQKYVPDVQDILQVQAPFHLDNTTTQFFIDIAILSVRLSITLRYGIETA